MFSPSNSLSFINSTSFCSFFFGKISEGAYILGRPNKLSVLFNCYHPTGIFQLTTGRSRGICMGGLCCPAIAVLFLLFLGVLFQRKPTSTLTTSSLMLLLWFLPYPSTRGSSCISSLSNSNTHTHSLLLSIYPTDPKILRADVKRIPTCISPKSLCSTSSHIDTSCQV